jgi:hypothetical protein
LLQAAIWVLTLAVVAGTVLGLWHLRATEGGSRPPLAVGLAHGLAGMIGFALLLVALRGPARGVANGVAAFGPGAASLFAAALVTGLGVLLLPGKSLTMAIHAGIAITGYALLLAWVALG